MFFAALYPRGLRARQIQSCGEKTPAPKIQSTPVNASLERGEVMRNSPNTSQMAASSQQKARE
jgi:hypothetical protein